MQKRPEGADFVARTVTHTPTPRFQSRVTLVTSPQDYYLGTVHAGHVLR